MMRQANLCNILDLGLPSELVASPNFLSSSPKFENFFALIVITTPALNFCLESPEFLSQLERQATFANPWTGHITHKILKVLLCALHVSKASGSD